MKTFAPNIEPAVKLLLKEMRASGWTEESIEYIGQAIRQRETVLEALKTAYEFFNTEAITPDDRGMTVAPDSIVMVILRKMKQAISVAEDK